MSAAALSSRTRVLAAFRRLNRARIQLFQGDDHAMAVTHQQMRAEFERNRHVPTVGPEFEAMLAGIDEATTMLKHEIIRGELNDETGRYRRYRTTILTFGASWIMDDHHPGARNDQRRLPMSSPWTLSISLSHLFFSLFFLLCALVFWNNFDLDLSFLSMLLLLLLLGYRDEN
jgi:hypothetical protein